LSLAFHLYGVVAGWLGVLFGSVGREGVFDFERSVNKDAVLVGFDAVFIEVDVGPFGWGLVPPLLALFDVENPAVLEDFG
jgi:hypothetical protein